MSEPSYQPGDVVNGHYLGTDNVWHPVTEGDAAANPVAPEAAMTDASLSASAPGGVAVSTAAPAATPTVGPTASQRKPHVLSIIALVTAAVGLIFACIPGALIVGWVLLPIAFVLSIVAFFLQGRKWPAITALALSVVGTIIGVVVFFAVVATSLSSALGTTDGQVSPTTASPSADADQAGDSGDTSGSNAAVNPNFGETFTYKDGVAITVSAPTPFTPGQYAAGADQANNVTLTFTITNGSKKNLDVLTIPTVTSAGVPASSVFDAADTTLALAPPSSTVLPGQMLTWTSAFSIADPNSLQVEIAPAVLAYQKAIFTNVAG